MTNIFLKINGSLQVKGEEKPKPTRGVRKNQEGGGSGGGEVAAGEDGEDGEEEEINMDDLVTRVDIRQVFFCKSISV